MESEFCQQGDDYDIRQMNTGKQRGIREAFRIAHAIGKNVSRHESLRMARPERMESSENEQ